MTRDIDQPTLVYIAGNAWDGVIGTDRRLANALSTLMPVLWVDPPVPIMWALRRGGNIHRVPLTGFDQIGPNICRLRIFGPPALTRPLMRSIASTYQRQSVTRLVSRLGINVAGVVVATPEGRFPDRIAGTKVYYVTDDWPAGASMMGINERRIKRLAQVNLKEANIAAAVSPGLLAKVTASSKRQVEPLLLANGCDPDMFAGRAASRPTDVPAGPFAIMVGQVNERLDLTAVRAVADRGLSVVIVGPRTERDSRVSASLDELFKHPEVSWIGSRPVDQLPDYLSAAAVGLTPYIDNEFNRASFPLKTLEYLAAGLPVVSSDLPAARWLDSHHLSIAENRDDFAAKTQQAMLNNVDEPEVCKSERRDFARSHSWDARAKTLLAAL